MKIAVSMMLALILTTALMPKAQACSTTELDRTLTVADDGFNPPDNAPDVARQAMQLILKLKECDQQGIVYPDAGEKTHTVIQGIQTKLDCKIAQVQGQAASKFCAAVGY